MNPLKYFTMLPSMLVLLTLFSSATSVPIEDKFLQCLYGVSTSISSVTFTPKNPSYTSILESRIQNLVFNTTDTPKPLAIVTSLHESHIQATIICARKHNIQIRIRSGGHDFEGLSYVSSLPFVVLDLINLRNIEVDVKKRVAWVETGATLGELYYRIAEKSRTLAFPAGGCPTVGVGGHFSEGGYGFLMRKYGLSADNIIDSRLVDVTGRILDRASMGEHLFWAIRGGGGYSFGVVIAWKVNLVQVPPMVTYFSVIKSLEQNAIQILHRWQYVANKLPHDIHLNAVLLKANSTIQVQFESLFLGRINSLLPLMEDSFPELGLKREDCREMSWIESLLPLAKYPRNASLDVLLDRKNTIRGKFKSKSDYVKEPMSENALTGIVKWFSDEEIKAAALFMIPYGGKMAEIAETSIAFPHRAGNLYKIGYGVAWDGNELDKKATHISWVRKVYSYMASYVSKNPRQAYLNYRDLDIGTNNLSGNTSYRRARIWGVKYFKNNFDRLVLVKTRVDPTNFFTNEQSIPPLSYW